MRVFAQTLASPSAFAGSRIIFMFSSPVGLFFILSLALAFSPHLLTSTATRVPSPFEGTLGGLVPCPVPSHGCWARGGITLRWESLQTYGFLGGRLAPWVGRAAELTPLLPPSHNQSQSSGAHSSWGCDRRDTGLCRHPGPSHPSQWPCCPLRRSCLGRGTSLWLPLPISLWFRPGHKAAGDQG